VGVGVTHASFGAEVQSEPSQLVRIVGFFTLVSGTQPQEPEGQEARHLVEARAAGLIGAERKLFGMAGDRKGRLEIVCPPAKVASDQNKSSSNNHLAECSENKSSSGNWIVIAIPAGTGHYFSIVLL
jgi:hypothetical protein